MSAEERDAATTVAEVNPRTVLRGDTTEATPIVSVVIPARNEAPTIQRAVSSIPVAALRRWGFDVEIIVVDNNSSDKTASLARKCRATVVLEPRSGYGRALRTGLSYARGAIVVIGDGDGTYPLNDLGRFLTPLLQGRADLVTGTRILGRILPGAMPALHRYIGVPLLTLLVNTLFGLGVSDAHCGMRALTREALHKMRFSSDGMEFATEMLIRAKQAGLRIAEIPIEYRPRPSHSISKLRSFADGWQHLALMAREFAALTQGAEPISSSIPGASPLGIRLP